MEKKMYAVSVYERWDDGEWEFVGYVKASTVMIATFIPIVKTLDDVTLDIKENAGTQIWNKPSTFYHNLKVCIFKAAFSKVASLFS